MNLTKQVFSVRMADMNLEEALDYYGHGRGFFWDLTPESTNVNVPAGWMQEIAPLLEEYNKHADGMGDSDLFDFVQFKILPIAEEHQDVPSLKSLVDYAEEEEDWDAGEIVDRMLGVFTDYEKAGGPSLPGGEDDEDY